MHTKDSRKDGTRTRATHLGLDLLRVHEGEVHEQPLHERVVPGVGRVPPLGDDVEGQRRRLLVVLKSLWRPPAKFGTEGGEGGGVADRPLVISGHTAFSHVGG